ncbi:MAG: hypothetical protein CMJ64_20975 [Planctomycetaceae bacterium]|nr:hypothetical protein [Planctomycetaceae bacterium]
MSEDSQEHGALPVEPEERCASDSPATTSILSLRRVFVIVLPITVVMLAIVVGFGFFDGAKWINDLLRPPMVAGSGQVLFRGAPLGGGELRSKPESKGLPGAMGFLDDQGRFDLKTDIDGDYVDGAFVGEHKVTVTLYGQAFAAGTPPLTPEKYASFDTTPLTIVVSKSSADNMYLITLQEDPDSIAE